jgi:hypothetical protein
MFLIWLLLFLTIRLYAISISKIALDEKIINNRKVIFQNQNTLMSFNFEVL